MGTLAGNISIKKQHSEFPSDVFLTFETLDAQVVVNMDESKQETMSLMAYLKNNTPKMVVTAFLLKSYPSDKFIFRSYKVSSSLCLHF